MCIGLCVCVYVQAQTCAAMYVILSASVPANIETSHLPIMCKSTVKE